MDRADRIILIENSIKKQKLDEIFPALVPLLMNVGRMAVSTVGKMAAKGGASLLRAGGNQLKNMAKSALTGNGGGGGGSEGGGGGGGGGGGDSGQPQFDLGSAAAEEESPDAPKVAKSGVEKQ